MERALEIPHLTAVDRQGRERAHPSPVVIRFHELERTAPDHLRLVESLARPRNPPREEERPDDRHRIAQLLRRAQRAAEQLLALVYVGLEVDRDVTEKTRGERQGERVFRRL